MSQRPRHPRKELEALLKRAEKQGWRVTKGKAYFKIYCPCADKHLRTVRLTPSNPNYQKNLEKMLARETCWKP